MVGDSFLLIIYERREDDIPEGFEQSVINEKVSIGRV